MIEEFRAMQLVVPYLQLAIWLVRGVAVILTILRVDSRNNRTLRPIPGAM